MEFALSEQERELLLRLLEENLGELRVEIRHTEGSDYRAKLHEQETCLRGLIDKLKAG